MSDVDYDIVIIGAGLSGIGAAVHLGRDCPGKSITLFESRENIGGTWDLFRYPGIRSDSDMFTLGYNFKPWRNEQSIADGSLIRKYINDAADENKIVEKIQFSQRIVDAKWSTEEQCWSLEVVHQHSGETRIVKAGFVMSCTGYYNYKSGYDPSFEGRDDFSGTIIHPQHWPEDFDYSGKRVVIIGSGATAVTLAPAMADKAAQVTMLQRSPSYVMSRPKVDARIKSWRERFSPRVHYRLARAKNLIMQFLVYKFCQFFPSKARSIIEGEAAKAIGPNVDIKHFSPKYNPWDERLCAVTDNDLFNSIRDGSVVMQTDQIERFTADGILLKSGKQLKTDIIVTATGLDVQLLGGMSLSVDQQPFDLTKKMVYRELLLEDLPNFGFVFGYTSASWTLKADMAMHYVGRLLKYMEKKSLKSVTPKNTSSDPGGLPFSDMQSGYMMRSRDKMPLRGHSLPWRVHHNYGLDFLMFRYSRINDGKLIFSKRKTNNSTVEKPLSTAAEI